jgi:acyl carrier protein
MTAVREILVDCICEKTGYPTDSVADGQALESDLGLDSIAKVELLSTVAERLSINLEDMDEAQTEKLEAAKTVEDLVKFIEEMCA